MNLDVSVAERNGAPERTVSVSWCGEEIHRDKFDIDVDWKLDKCVHAALKVLNDHRRNARGDEDKARWNYPVDGRIIDEKKWLKELIRRRANEADQATDENQGTAPAPDLYDDVDLLTTDLPEPKWAVPGILPVGVTLVVASPKIGKTWLMLGCATAIVSGGRAFGKILVPEPGDVLYLALEDNRRRMKSRMEKLTAADAEVWGEKSYRIQWAHNWPRLDEGGVKAIERWLQEHPNARLVVIDTLKKIRPRRRHNGNAYDEDYDAIEPLVEVAERYEVSIVFVHHTRKAKADDALDEVSGTHGLSGAADTILILQRARGKAKAVLHVTGRDVDEQELALGWDKQYCQWNLLGDAAEHAGNELRLGIMATLKAATEPMTPAQVAEALGHCDKSDKAAIRQSLSRMAKEGKIGTAGHGKYVFDSQQPVSPCHFVTTDENTPENTGFSDAGDCDNDCDNACDSRCDEDELTFP